MKQERYSSNALAVLALLYEAPMHPYRMQQLIRERGKDEVVNVRQRATLYQTIERLARTQLIAVRATERDLKRPERTIYEITERGRATLLAWMRELLATPSREFPAFPAVLAHLTLLTPTDARQQLERRAELLRGEVARLAGELEQGLAVVPRLFLIELEYLRAAAAAELEWVVAVVAELSAGTLSWDDAWLRSVAEAFERGAAPPSS